MKTIQVALLQLLPGLSLEANLQKGIDACRQAKRMGADIALFPELWSNGYQLSEEEEQVKKAAIPAGGAFVRAYAELAKELKMAIGITFLEQHEPLPRNTLHVYDRLGRCILAYSKVHTCDFGDEKSLTAGDGFYTAQLDTGEEKVTLGTMICYDREFPESARILMLKGAEIILVPNACPMEINRLSQLRARAFENMVGIATANYAYGKPDCNGHSSAFDGIAYRENEPGSRDTLIIEAGEAEGIYLAAFPIEEMRAYRLREVHGNAYRHPEKYGLLTECVIEPPFVRADYRK